MNYSEHITSQNLGDESLRAVIVDDEKHQRIALRHKLQKSCPDTITIVGEARSVRAAIKLIHETDPDIVFLDVELNDGRGFDVLDAFEKPDFSIIFITGYRDFAVDAYQYRAIDYLLKPVEEQRLCCAVQRVRDSLLPGEKQSLKPQSIPIAYPAAVEKIRLPTIDSIKLVGCEEIIFCQSIGSYTEFTLTNQAKTTVSKGLVDFEPQLLRNGFLRIHRSTVINLRYLVEILPKRRSCQVVLAAAGERFTLDVSEYYRNALINGQMPDT